MHLTRARELRPALEAQGLRVPADISIVTVGWGVADGGSDMTIVSVDWFEVVRMAVHRLQNRMDGRVRVAARLGCTGELNDGGTTGTATGDHRR